MTGKCTPLLCKPKCYLGKTTRFYEVFYLFLKENYELLNWNYPFVGETTRFYAFEMLILITITDGYMDYNTLYTLYTLITFSYFFDAASTLPSVGEASSNIRAEYIGRPVCS